MMLRKLFVLQSLAIAASFLAAFSSHAHLMVAQHGTLNITDGGVFMVLSVPATAFSGIDDDRDERLSTTEIQKHHDEILEQIQKGLSLIVDGEVEALKGPILSPTFGHGEPHHTASQIVITGRFPLSKNPQTLQFKTLLFGTKADEKTIEVSIKTPAAVNRKVVILTPDKAIVNLLE
ncbi:MAG: hypothetical protein ACSHXK_06015 [Oceanococcus sp.]